jgi:hypothetical protein
VGSSWKSSRTKGSCLESSVFPLKAVVGFLLATGPTPTPTHNLPHSNSLPLSFPKIYITLERTKLQSSNREHLFTSSLPSVILSQTDPNWQQKWYSTNALQYLQNILQEFHQSNYQFVLAALSSTSDQVRVQDSLAVHGLQPTQLNYYTVNLCNPPRTSRAPQVPGLRSQRDPCLRTLLGWFRTRFLFGNRAMMQSSFFVRTLSFSPYFWDYAVLRA